MSKPIKRFLNFYFEKCEFYKNLIIIRKLVKIPVTNSRLFQIWLWNLPMKFVLFFVKDVREGEMSGNVERVSPDLKDSFYKFPMQDDVPFIMRADHGLSLTLARPNAPGYAVARSNTLCPLAPNAMFSFHRCSLSHSS